MDIALLKCGEFSEEIQEQSGNYTKVFKNWLQASLPNPLVNKFNLDTYDVVQDIYPNEDLYDCIMITGSPANPSADIYWINKLARYVAHVAENKPRVKIVGICFGHQIIARALGGECVSDTIWELGITPIKLTNIGKQLFGRLDTVNIQEMHTDYVLGVPPSFHLLGSSPTTYNQGMVRFSESSGTIPSTALLPIQILTVQGHPEFIEPIVTAMIEEGVRSGTISKEAADDAMTRRFWRNDGVKVLGKAIWKVLLEK